MKYDIIFELHQRVWIPEIESWGVVNQICITEVGIQYEVRYFHSGKLEKVWFLDRELKGSK